MPSRAEWITLLGKELFFPNFPSEFKVRIRPLIPEGCDLNWVFRIIIGEDILADKLGHIDEKDQVSIFGCYYCLSEHQSFKDNQLYVAGAKAKKLSEALMSCPEGMQKAEIDYMNIWVCPHCQGYITRWKV
jgi:hypothetical protein